MAQEAAAYNPWGRAGCGAPLRSSSGRAIADLTEVQPLMLRLTGCISKCHLCLT